MGSISITIKDPTLKPDVGVKEDGDYNKINVDNLLQAVPITTR